MKNRIRRSALILFLVTMIQILHGQTLTELAVPKYFGSKSATSANNARTPFVVCLSIDGLTPNTVYDVKGGIGLVSDPPTTFGAGNLWDGSAFSASRLDSVFTTDLAGSSGPFWLFFQPTGNAARFDAGQLHNLRIGFAVTGGTIPGVPAFIGSKVLTALDIAPNQRTPSGSDDGAFIKGSAMPAVTGKYVFLYDNAGGLGDPVFVYQARQAIPVQSGAQQDLPAAISDIYRQSGSSSVGDYPGVIPTGSNNPSGIRRIEARNPDFTIYGYNTDDDGIWPSGGNTTAAVRREVVFITTTDAPLIPTGPVPPTVATDSLVTDVSSDSATSGGNVTAGGGDTLLIRGLCWSLSAGPTVADSSVVAPGTMGTFSATMTPLLPDTLYHYRAFATNTAGTVYGHEYTFRTLCTPHVPVSGFWAEETDIHPGDTLNFFDSTLYCPETWNWSFVGGIPMSSPLPNPTGIIFNYPGDFNICLTTSNPSGVHTLCRHGYIHVTEPVIPAIVITEIMYNPPESGTDSLEFIELYNHDSVPVNLQGFWFSEGITLQFPEYVMDPGEYIVVGKDTAALFNTFGIHALKWSGTLSNGGELILLKDSEGHTVDSVAYDDTQPWDPLCAGEGHSLELCDPGSDNALAENWRHALGMAAINTEGDTLWAWPGNGCLQLPAAAFSASDTSIVKGDSVVFTSLASGSPVSFEWTFEGGIPGTFSGEFPPPVLYENAGLYDVSLTVFNLAGSGTLTRENYIEANTPAGVGSPVPFISLYPNPAADGRFKVRFARPGLYEVALYTATGRTVMTTRPSFPGADIDQPGLAPGLYMVRVRNLESGREAVVKVVIQ